MSANLTSCAPRLWPLARCEAFCSLAQEELESEKAEARALLAVKDTCLEEISCPVLIAG